MLGHYGKIRTLEVDAAEISYFLRKILLGYVCHLGAECEIN